MVQDQSQTHIYPEIAKMTLFCSEDSFSQTIPNPLMPISAYDYLSLYYFYVSSQ